MTTIGYAVLQIVPSLRGVSGEITKQLAAMPEVGAAAGKKIGKELEQGVAQGAEGAAGQVKSRLSERLGAQVGSVVGKSIGAGIKLGIAGGAAAATAAVAGIGITLKKGFDRLESIDQATFKLKALGHSADETKTIMDNALQAVKGTAFGLGDAANIAASAVAAGVKPGKDLAKYLSDVSDAAAVAGVDLASMGDTMNNVTTLNAAYNDSLQILAQKGLPIYDWLSDSLHTSTANVKELAAEGKISAQQFQEAIETHIGGAAKSMGQSFDGAVDNLEASVARLGANFITAALGGDPSNALQGPTQAIGALTDKFDDIGKWVNEHSGEIHEFFIDIKNVAVEAAGAVKDIGTWLVENKTAAEVLAGVFVGWKVLSVVNDVVGSLKGMSTLLRVTLPADAAAGATAMEGSIGGIVSAMGPLLAIPGFLAFADSRLKDAAPSAENARARGAEALANRGGGLAGSGKDPAQRPDAPYVPTPARSGSLDGPNGVFGGGATYVPPNPGGYLIPGKKDLFGNGFSSGGNVFGAGSATSDSIPAMLSNGEHVWTADEVNKLGGQSAMYRLRGMVKSGLLKGFDSGGAVNPNPLLNILLGQGGQRDNWAEYSTYDPMQHKLLKRNMVGVDPSGLRTPGGGIFNSAMSIDTSNVSVSPRPKWGYDQWRLTFDDFADATTYQKGERDNPSFYKKQAQLKNDPLGAWILGYAGGGAVGPDVAAAEALVGTPYSMAKRFDCSGDVARVISQALGVSGGGLMTTANAQQWLSALGFKPGIGGPGSISVGWKNGGPGGGHMAMTLSDGRNAEGGGSHPNFLVGAGAAGASSPQFTNHMFLPIAAGTGKPSGNGLPDALFGNGPTDGAAIGGEGASVGGSPGISLPSSLSGLSSFGFDSLGAGVGTTGSGSDLSLFGKAAGAAVSGQVSSALGVFGGGGTPGFLNAASQLIGGIKVGGQGLGSSAPLSAMSNHRGTAPPDDAGNMHGTRANQLPGPQVVYNIRTATTEDAFLEAQRRENVRNAAKLDRY